MQVNIGSTFTFTYFIIYINFNFENHYYNTNVMCDYYSRHLKSQNIIGNKNNTNRDNRFCMELSFTLKLKN